MIINKFIIHVLDKNSEFPILNDVENTITPETDAFYQKVIRRILRAARLPEQQPRSFLIASG